MCKYVFDYKGIQLSVGDSITMTPTDDKDSGFYRSTIGKRVSAGFVDKINIEVVQTEWLEIWYNIRLIKNDVVVNRAEHYSYNESLKYEDLINELSDYEKEDPKSYADSINTPYVESSMDTMFLRYMIDNSSTKEIEVVDTNLTELGITEDGTPIIDITKANDLRIIFKFLHNLQENFKVNSFCPVDISLIKNGNTVYATVKDKDGDVILHRWCIDEFDGFVVY